MKAIQITLLIMLCTVDRFSPAAVPQEIDRKFIAKSFKLQIATNKLVVSSGTPVAVDVVFTNTSSRDLDLPNEPMDWIVQRQDDGVVPDTDEGIKRKKLRHAATSLDVAPLLKAGSTISRKEILSNLYDMSSPSVYLISARQAISDKTGTDVIASNNISVTVR